MRMSNPTPQEEALRAIAQVRQMLDGRPIDALGRYQACAALDYAAEQVQAIQVLKRARRRAAELEPKP